MTSKSDVQEQQQTRAFAPEIARAAAPVTREHVSTDNGASDDSKKLKRRHVQKACEACRRSKVKCDDKRPCSFCVRNGDAETCRPSVLDPNAPTDEEPWYLNDQESAFLLSKPKRKQVSRACLPCRRSKVKCDESRPCGRCMRLGKVDSCLQSDGAGEELALSARNSQEEEREVERPIAYKGTLSFAHDNRFLKQECFLVDVMKTHGWAHAVLKRCWEFGTCQKSLLEIFVNLPPELESVIKRGLTALDVLVKERTAAMAKKMGKDILQRSNTSKQRKEGEIIEDLENKIWESSEHAGVMRLKWNPASDKRDDVFVTDTLAKMNYMHKEEMLARLANRETPLHMTQFDWLCYCLDDILRSKQHTCTRYARFRSIGPVPGYSLVRHVTEKQFDWLGRSEAIRHFMMICSPEEFNATQQRDPTSCRPFAHDIGDHRDGHALLQEAPADDMETIASMVQTSAGREKLSLLAKALEKRFAPLVEAAEAVKMTRNNQEQPQLPTSSGAPNQMVPGGSASVHPPANSGTMFQQTGALNFGSQSLALASSLQQIRENFLNSEDSVPTFVGVQGQLPATAQAPLLPTSLRGLPPQHPAFQPSLGAFHGLYANQALFSTLVPHPNIVQMEGDREYQATESATPAAAAAAATGGDGSVSFGGAGAQAGGTSSLGMLPTEMINPFDFSRLPSLQK